MPDPELIAEKTIYAVAEDGKSGEIHIMIGKPYQAESGKWACPIALAGLHDKLPDVNGVDSWQSLILATRLLKLFLSFFVEAGGKLLNEQGGDEISLNYLFWDENSSSEPEVPVPDDPLSPEEQSRIDELTPEQIRAIDDAILANCSVQFRKVARVVFSAMDDDLGKEKRIPDRFYGQRVYKLVGEGKLISQGKIGYMRFCEVRLPGD